MQAAGFATPAMEDTLTIILAGGRGERLRPLTVRRAKPAVPFANGDSWIGPRSIVAGGSVDRCVLGRNVQVGPNASLAQSILFDDVVVSPGASLRRVIVEEGVNIPTHARIGFDPEEDRRWGAITAGGVTVVTRWPSALPAHEKRLDEQCPSSLDC